MAVSMRVVLDMRDGRRMSGYTTAFDPNDRSVLVGQAPDSPAGTLVPLDRVRVLLLMARSGRRFPLPGAAHQSDSAETVQIDFGRGMVLEGKKAADVEGVGVWIDPPGQPLARAFVPAGAFVSMSSPDGSDATLALDGKAGLPERKWATLLQDLATASLAPPPPPSSRSRSEAAPTEAVPVVPLTKRKETASSSARTIEVPRLSPPPNFASSDQTDATGAPTPFSADEPTPFSTDKTNPDGLLPPDLDGAGE